MMSKMSNSAFCAQYCDRVVADSTLRCSIGTGSKIAILGSSNNRFVGSINMLCTFLSSLRLVVTHIHVRKYLSICVFFGLQLPFYCYDRHFCPFFCFAEDIGHLFDPVMTSFHCSGIILL